MRDVVRTSILSKRWKNLWTTTPYLKFDRRDSSKFINRVLILWKGLKILKFKVVFSLPRNGSVYSDIDSWVHLAKENGIEELHLEDMYTQSDESGVPHILYSCSSLKVLSLIGCKLQIDGNVNVNVQWNQLRSLTIVECDIDEHLITQVVSGSPQLEVLFLNLPATYENLNIRSNSLKKLAIKRYHCYDDNGEVEPSTELRIWSPNLETLDFEGEPYGKYLLINVSSLTHLTLDFFYECFGAYFVGEKMWQIFRTIRHVENLTISDWCIKALGTMEKEYLLSPLLNFKFIKIDHGNLPESFLLQLRTVEIKCYAEEDLIFPLIEILLKHATMLQKMVIHVRGIKPPSMPWLLAQKFLEMPRSSPTAKLIFAEF